VLGLLVSNRVASCQSTHATCKVSHRHHSYIAIWAYLDHVTLPLMTLQASDRRKHIFDIAMTPVLAFDFRYRRDVSSTESVCAGWKKDEDRDSDKQHVLRGDSHDGGV